MAEAAAMLGYAAAAPSPRMAGRPETTVRRPSNHGPADALANIVGITNKSLRAFAATGLPAAA
jgi:hypothetical protein